jgi:hypothetical protein
MFSNNKAADKLAAALAEYQKDFEKRLQSAPNADAEEAKRRIERATTLIGQSGLGNALVTLLSHTEHWPSWSKRDDFGKYVGFPVGEVLAQEERQEEKYRATKIVIVLFVYQGARYGMVFKDTGSSIMPDGDSFQSGTLEFLANGEVVLGLDISLGNEEFAEWRYFGVNALKMGSWSKALLEIAAYIRAHDSSSRSKRNDDYAINKAKNIRL